MKRLTAFLLILTVCLGLFTACGKDKIPDGECELWVVTELTQKYGMNDQAERIIAQFQERYPNVTVKLDILPTDDEERAVYLEKIRTQIMGGGGPDVYLMPTRSVVPDDRTINETTKKVEPLFRDVGVAMSNGIFYDISEFYDEDETLEKEELNTSVMDGGIVENARYVLPLRYELGVYLVSREKFEAVGADVSVFDKGVDDVMKLALELNDIPFAKKTIPSNFEYFFSEKNDYQSSNVLLTVEEVKEFMELYQAVNVLAGSESDSCYATSNGYIVSDAFFTRDGYVLCQSTLSSLVDCVATAKLLGESFEMYPMRASDGTLNAIVRYYAAVGAGSLHPELSYEFAKMFLNEDAQYEGYLSEKAYEEATTSACIGWPVRTIGSTEPRLKNLQFQWENMDISFISKTTYRKERFAQTQLDVTDADIPALMWQVDEVRFPTSMEAEDSITHFTGQLNDFFNNNAALDVDIDALAREYIETLQFYLDEG